MVFSSILAWRIPWTEEPGGLQSMESDMTEHIDTHTLEPCLAGNGSMKMFDIFMILIHEL